MHNDNIKGSFILSYLFTITSIICFGTPSEVSPVNTPSKPAGEGPAITFATPVFDFGTVIGGKVVKHEFFFTNTGTKLLEIRDITTSCGCATAGKWTREVAPGKSGSIPMEFFTVNLSGSVIKPIEIHCNVTNSPSVNLQVKGTVWWPVEMSPTSATLSFRSGAATNAIANVRIINNEKAPLTLSEPVCNNPRIAAELSTVRPGMEYQLRVKLVPPLGSGNVFGQIQIKTSSEKRPLLELPVYAVMQSDVIALPSPLILPGKMTVNQLKQSVSIRSFWTNALSLSEVSLNVKGVSLELHELQPGRFFTFTLLFPDGFQITPGQNIELKVKTNHPNYPVVKVPITQQTSPITTSTPEKQNRPNGTM